MKILRNLFCTPKIFKIVLRKFVKARLAHCEVFIKNGKNFSHPDAGWKVKFFDTLLEPMHTSWRSWLLGQNTFFGGV